METPFLPLGIVLAAGQSMRMGRPKALLRLPGGAETFVARAVRTLRDGGAADVIVVCRPDDEALRDHVARLLPPAVTVVNADASRGQLSSLLAGIDAAEARGADAIIVLPVDIPEVRADTVSAVVRALQAGGTPIVRATHNRRHGHPVAFRASMFDELRAADPAHGARVVLHALPERVHDLEVDDPGVLRDVDRPEDFERLYGTLPE